MDLDNLKTGDAIYYIDKSEGPGVVMYVQGTVLAVKEPTVTLEVTNSGWLIGAGDEEPWTLSYRPGSTLEVKIDGRYTFIATPAEFSEVEKQYNVVPAPIEEANHYPDVVEEAKEDPLDKPEEEREETREEIEEGAPDLEDEGDGLNLVASLDSWSRSPDVNIRWPKGFTKEQMAELENIYEKIPKGSVNKSIPWGMSREGPGRAEPVVTVPGGKGAGIMPYLRQFTDERLKGKHKGIQEEFELAGEAVQKAKEEENEARSQWDESSADKDRVEWKDKEKKLKKAINNFKEVNKRLQRLLTRPPEEMGKRKPSNTFTQVPGRRAPHDTEMRGRAGLREELRQLSDKYRKTEDLLEAIKDKEDITNTSAREMDIIFNLRKNRLKKLPVDKIENALRRLKYQEFKSMPYLWSTSRSKEGENPLISERDRVLEAAELSKGPYTQKVGGQRTFFDLTPEEVNHFAKQDAKKLGPLPVEVRDKLAWKYANEYVSLVDERVGWKDLSAEIQDYARAKYGVVISPERADRLEKEVSSRSQKEVVARGRDTVTNAVVERSIPIDEIYRNVVKKTKNSFNKQVKWLKALQHQRERDLAVEKAKARRLLAEKDEDKIISDQKYKEAILSLFHKYAKTSHEADTAKVIPNRYEVEHGHRAYEEKVAEATEIQAELKALEEELAKLRGQRHAAFVPYKKASEDLDLKQDDIGRLSNPDASQEQVKDILEASEALSEEIKKQISRREVLLNFYKGREDWEEKVKKGVATIDNAIKGLEQERSKLFNSKIEPPEVAKDIRRLDSILKTELNKWLKIERELDAEVEAVHVKMDEVHKRKSKLEEEIGPLKEKGK